MRDTFIKQMSVAIISAMIIGLGGYIWGMAIHIDRVNAEVNGVSRSLVNIEKKVNRIHWYLIERNSDASTVDQINTE